MTAGGPAVIFYVRTYQSSTSRVRNLRRRRQDTSVSDRKAAIMRAVTN